MHIALHVKYPLFLSNLNYLDIFSKSAKLSNFIKILPVEADFSYGDEDTDRQT
jgi:hypothetical protein